MIIATQIKKNVHTFITFDMIYSLTYKNDKESSQFQAI